jgi:flagellar biosynthesis/type III secretory pathway chaperone
MNPVEHALEELRHALAEFAILLEREADALTDVQPDLLSGVVEEKTRWADRANTAWQQLAAAARDVSGRSAGLDQTLGFDPRYAAVWAEIKELAARAGRLNQHNNVLIEAQLRRTRQAMDVLQTAAHRGAIYGADGQMVGNYTPLHTLDKA